VKLFAFTELRAIYFAAPLSASYLRMKLLRSPILRISPLSRLYQILFYVAMHTPRSILSLDAGASITPQPPMRYLFDI